MSKKSTGAPKLTRRNVVTGMSAAAVSLASPPVIAADWPAKPVRVLYNYPAGTGGDVVIRHICEALTRQMGQPFIVENRGGAAGTVGVETAWRGPTDGYTFLASPNAPMVLLPQLRKVPYDPKDLRPISAVGEYIYAWSVLPSLGVKTVADLIALAKSKPGHLSYSSPGAGSATNLRGEALNILAGVQITHIPYRGGPDALNDFLAGNVSIMVDNNQFSQVRAGKALNLAMTTHRRHPDFPDVPTMAEAGYKIDLPTWLAMYAMKGIPDEIATKFGAAVAEVVSRPEVKRRMLDIGFFAMDEKPAELLAMNDAAIDSFATWVKRANFKVE